MRNVDCGKQITAGRMALFFCLLILLLGVCGAVFFSPEHQSVDRSPIIHPGRASSVNIGQVIRVAKALQVSGSVCLVQFTTAMYPTQEQHTALPRTRVSARMLQESNQKLTVDGTFTLLRKLHGKAMPNWGRINEDIAVERRWGGNEAYHRLARLLSPVDAVAPVVLLAVTPSPRSGPLDSTFIGWLTQSDQDWVGELITTLVRVRFDKINKERAELLLLSSNPWIVYLGLARLQVLESLKATHFRHAFRVRAVEDTEKCVRDLFDSQGLNATVRQDLADVVPELICLPGKQLQVVKALCNSLAFAGSGTREDLDLQKLGNAASAYRAKIQREAGSAELVKQIDELIALATRPPQQD